MSATVAVSRAPQTHLRQPGDAAVESRLLGVSGVMDISPYKYRLFRRRRVTPVHEAHSGEGEDPEIGPPF